MLQLSYIRDNKEAVIKGLNVRFFKNPETAIDAILDLDQTRRQNQQKLNKLQGELNSQAKLIGSLMREGKRDEAQSAKEKTSLLKTETKVLAEKLQEVEKNITEALYQIPNIPHSSVRAGRGEDENEVIKEHGNIPTLGKAASPHWDLIKQHAIIDFELGNKISAAGFPVYKGKGARIQRALINFFLDEALAAGYTEIQPPLLINEASGIGTGQLPDKEGQMYHDAQDNLYLIPTAEIPITNIYRDVILTEKELPIKHVGYTPCFRREAGSWGANVRGLNRLHQFDKVEIVRIEHPDNSYKVLEQMREHVEGLLQKLELPYRVLRLCGGDIGFTAALCYDLEVFSAAQKRWLEVSSISNFETFQANRLKLRFKDSDNNKHLAHTLNGSALALPRILAAILENNQEEGGKINIPKVLQPYCGFSTIG
jgi:seryl-tRNA synthetase